jgi:hypothetical protein
MRSSVDHSAPDASSEAPTPQTCRHALRLVAHVQRVALDSADNFMSDPESPEVLLSVPVPLIPYVQSVRALRRELARERAARAALQAALARMVEQLAKNGLTPEG